MCPFCHFFIILILFFVKFCTISSILFTLLIFLVSFQYHSLPRPGGSSNASRHFTGDHPSKSYSTSFSTALSHVRWNAATPTWHTVEAARYSS